MSVILTRIHTADFVCISFDYYCIQYTFWRLKMISANNVTLRIGKKALFEDVNIKFTEGNCYGLIGANGAGKSTFLKILSGQLDTTNGNIVITPGQRLSVLEQDHFKYDAFTVMDTVIMGNQRLYDIMKEKDAIYAKEDFSEEDGIRASELEGEFAEMNGWEAESDAATLLNGLGIEPDLHYTLMGDLNGNEKVKVLLARALFGNPDILLLDEPTNHLDLGAIEWLEEFLISNGKAVVVISHDRTFVDNITTRTIEVTMGRIYDYKVNYSKYLELRKDRRAQQQKAYDEQQKMIAETKDFIERFKGTYSKTLQVQSRVKMLEKLELIEVDEEDTSALRLKFPPSPRSGSYPVIAQELSKYYGDHLVFKEAGFTIQREEKVAFVGRNGEGKSTLVKCIMGEITDYTGKLTLGHNVQIGYFAQNQASLLDEELTVFQTVDDVTPSELKSNTKNLLGAFMFSGDDIDKKVKVLSGGERTRLAMIKLLLQPVNLLILDEPTNHLDLKTKDILKNALIDFDGTLIVVSHDRDFLNGLAQKVYEFGNGKVTEHLEDINGFLRKKKMENLREIESRKS